MTTIHFVLAAMFCVSAFIITLVNTTTRFYPVEGMREILALMVKYEPHYSHTDPCKFRWFLRLINNHFVFTAIGLSFAVASLAIQMCFLFGLMEGSLTKDDDGNRIGNEFLLLLICLPGIGALLGWVVGEWLGQTPMLKSLRQVSINPVGKIKSYDEEVNTAYQVNGKFKFTVAVLEHFQWPYQVNGIFDEIELDKDYRYLIEFKYGDNQPGFVLIQSQAPLYDQFFRMLGDNGGFVHHEVFQLIASEIIARTSAGGDINAVELGRRYSVSVEEINLQSTKENASGHSFKSLKYWPLHVAHKAKLDDERVQKRLNYLTTHYSDSKLKTMIEDSNLRVNLPDDTVRTLRRMYDLKDRPELQRMLTTNNLSLWLVTAEETENEDTIVLMHDKTGVGLTINYSYRTSDQPNFGVNQEQYFNYLVSNVDTIKTDDSDILEPAMVAFGLFSTLLQPVVYTSKEADAFSNHVVRFKLRSSILTKLNYNEVLTFKGVRGEDFQEMYVEAWDEYVLISTDRYVCDEYRKLRLSDQGVPLILREVLMADLRTFICLITNQDPKI